MVRTKWPMSELRLAIIRISLKIRTFPRKIYDVFAELDLSIFVSGTLTCKTKKPITHYITKIILSTTQIKDEKYVVMHVLKIQEAVQNKLI